MRFIKRAFSLINSTDSEGSGFVSKALSIIGKIGILPTLLGIVPIVMIFVIFITFMGIFSYKLNLLQLVDPNGGESGNDNFGVNLNYDFEDYLNIIDSASYGSSDVAGVLSGVNSSVDQFNSHLKDMVNQAGFGTRQGVVAAGVAMSGEYAKITKQRIPYNQRLRQQPGGEGIVNSSSMYLDCSSFSFGALYNGGFNLPPIIAQTDYIYEWASSNGMVKSISEGQPGDFIITEGKGHIMLIVGSFDGGYYIAHANYSPHGVTMIKLTYDQARSYCSTLSVVIDMTSYYNNSSNVRQA